jgi:lantibiotic biosynthesis protein
MNGEPKVFLEAAHRIGQTLLRAAHWDAEHQLCNWIGRTIMEKAAEDAPIVPRAAALGPELYSGTAGIGLFLARLAALTGDPEVRTAANAAVRNALRNATRLPNENVQALAFHAGLIGIAFAAHRVAELTAATDLRLQADALLTRVGAEAASPHVFDVIGGNAGAIPALLTLASELGRSDLLDFAVKLGEELLAEAQRHGQLWTWDGVRTMGEGAPQTLLTGLAHGAAGLGLSLMELHSATGRADFLEAGRGAFAYEDALFDPGTQNWPDLRSFDSPREAASGKKFAVAWCHGAPGIALARARAARLDAARGAAHAAVARTALTTTLDAIDKNIKRPRVDTTLCHGLAGLAEIALTVGAWLDDQSALAAANRTARTLLERHSVLDDWPSGVASGGPNPSLMLGTAGVGYHFLRQYDLVQVSTPLWFNGTNSIKKPLVHAVPHIAPPS